MYGLCCSLSLSDAMQLLCFSGFQRRSNTAGDNLRHEQALQDQLRAVVEENTRMRRENSHMQARLAATAAELLSE